ncbi:hypothetical protein Tco_1301975 [Tanacetum coccineum]
MADEDVDVVGVRWIWFNQLPDNKISDPDDHLNDDDDNMVDDEPGVDVSNLTGKQKKLFALKLKMNEAGNMIKLQWLQKRK